MEAVHFKHLYLRGQRGRGVRSIQQRLNETLNGQIAALRIDGIFGMQTERAIRRFQQSERLVIDGDAGPCTLAALFGLEKYNIIHHVTLFPQMDPTACWLASTSMLLNRSIPRSAVPADLIASDGGLLNDSELKQPKKTLAYANFFGLRIHSPRSWTADGLANILYDGPAIANILWNESSYTAGTGSSGHMVVIAGIRGDGTAKGTTLRIYDPWPTNQGRVGSFGYYKLMGNTPCYTYNLYQKA